MKHSIALVTGATSGLGYAAARLLAAKGYREVIVTGRSLRQIKEATVQLAADTKKQIFTPMELDLNDPTNVDSAVAALVKQGRPVDFLLLNAGLVPYKQRVLTAAGVEASQAPLIGHHQLTVGLLNASLLSPNARIVIAGAEPARGGVPMFKYTDLPEFAAKYFEGDRTVARVHNPDSEVTPMVFQAALAAAHPNSSSNASSLGKTQEELIEDIEVFDHQVGYLLGR
ncbi:SDR family NAD(P)-dependent oxidoreductase [Silvibacterium dinghuense]|uniref:SDR family NAD(P)-dependent oxidoreductase n=1 Tax=Silvibacterium dinghuense TaxID=1560006 RepID=A0A4Q1SD16_9BACT|nr:SDR family NAD(P)-dependent oxidoreductase [Silvibacterium dinghuense]RXS95112.1 SDR family NAD(P)-dependent oxidoreductase [Silvibacterium dinghuense]GGH10733.1 hypothetical protein GCM10011586_29190 [Silvibacterium dinghuense]